MTVELFALLASYLEEKTGIESIQEWIALNVWHRSPEARDLIDQVAVELAYINDRVSDEEAFRVRMAEILVPTVAINDTRESNNAVSSGASQSFNAGLSGGVGVVEIAPKAFGFNLQQEAPPEVENLQAQLEFA